MHSLSLQNALCGLTVGACVVGHLYTSFLQSGGKDGISLFMVKCKLPLFQRLVKCIRSFAKRETGT